MTNYNLLRTLIENKYFKTKKQAGGDEQQIELSNETV